MALKRAISLAISSSPRSRVQLPMSKERNIVIIGGGIIGCTSAFYITHHPSYSPETTSVTILEASTIAGGASGKAGGLVAKWAYPRELVNVSFPEHERLAREHGGAERWGWRYTSCGQWEGRGEDVQVGQEEEMTSRISLEKKDGLHAADTIQDSGRKGRRKVLPDDLDWVKEELTKSYEPMAGEGETAQVHPYQFTTSMCVLAQEKGAKVIHGKATSIAYTDLSTTKTGKQTRGVSSVSYTDSSSGKPVTLPATHVILSAGPWTPTVLANVPISGTRAHSIVIRPTRPVSAYCLFTDILMPSSQTATPEIYARPNSEVYACSPGDGLPLPPSTAEVQVDSKVCDALFKQVAAISPELRRGEVVTKQACYLPNVHAGPRGCPIVGEDEKTKGLVIAAGHTCWGICNAPGTGRAVSELIMDGKITCANLSKLAPKNFGL